MPEDRSDACVDMDARHALVVGGTGMLAAVVTGLARRGWRTTVVGTVDPWSMRP